MPHLFPLSLLHIDLVFNKTMIIFYFCPFHFIVGLVCYRGIITHPRIQWLETADVCGHSCGDRAARVAGPGAFIPGGRLGRLRAWSAAPRVLVIAVVGTREEKQERVQPGRRAGAVFLFPTCHKRTKAFFLASFKEEIISQFLLNSRHPALYANAQAHLRHLPIT